MASQDVTPSLAQAEPTQSSATSPQDCNSEEQAKELWNQLQTGVDEVRRIEAESEALKEELRQLAAAATASEARALEADQDETSKAADIADRGGVVEISAQFGSLVSHRSECFEALQLQMKAAEATQSFIFAHRTLDGLTAVALSQYLRSDCRAKFVDLSSLGRWSEVLESVTAAVKHGLRSMRLLTLDGNDVGSFLDGFQDLCGAFEAHPGLQQVSLRDTGLTDGSAYELAAMLRRNSVLFSIDVGLNRIGDNGISSLIDALSNNGLILELTVDGTDASDATHAALEASLRRNNSRLIGRSGGGKMLQRLRHARANAAAIELSQAAHSDAGTSLPSVPVLPRDTTFWLPQTNAEDRASALANSIFFDAGEGVTAELAARCEAGWRYNAVDQELLRELQRYIAELKVRRRHEHDRGNEVHARIAEVSCGFRERLTPKEQQIYRMREQLAVEVEATKDILRLSLEKKLELGTLREALEQVQRDEYYQQLRAGKAQHTLRLRHQEILEEMEPLQRAISDGEQDADKLAADNAACRKKLHGMRFETDSERFAPLVPAATTC